VKLLVVGGRLQGTEATYLASKAGYETVLVDRVEDPPAAGLADRVVVADITADEALGRALVGACDAVLPACEDEATLGWLAARVPAWGGHLLFDLGAYRITRSKLQSHHLFDSLGVPRPASWPGCGYPVVVKPDASSGSEGVTVARDETAVATARAELADLGHEAVVEAFVAGPSLSLEVVAWGERVLPLLVTGLEFDAAHDCKRVVAPVGEAGPGADPGARLLGVERDWTRAVLPGILDQVVTLGQRLAGGLGLRGVMDVEVVAGEGGDLRVLEIDARLPSQTPTVVYWSSGLNVVELLVEMAGRGLPGSGRRVDGRAACVYQHVRARGGALDVVGEHVLARARPLRLVPGFYGADEALTDRDSSASSWVATLITTGATLAEAAARGAQVVETIARLDGLVLQPGTLGVREGAP
jgi:3-methylornithine--L-lysine ligase